MNQFDCQLTSLIAWLFCKSEKRSAKCRSRAHELPRNPRRRRWSITKYPQSWQLPLHHCTTLIDLTNHWKCSCLLLFSFTGLMTGGTGKVLIYSSRRWVYIHVWLQITVGVEIRFTASAIYKIQSHAITSLNKPDRRSERSISEFQESSSWQTQAKKMYEHKLVIEQHKALSIGGTPATQQIRPQ